MFMLCFSTIPMEKQSILFPNGDVVAAPTSPPATRMPQLTTLLTYVSCPQGDTLSGLASIHMQKLQKKYVLCKG
jgi:hypothetical protein